MAEWVVPVLITILYWGLAWVILKVGVRPAMVWLVELARRGWHGPAVQPLEVHDMNLCQIYQKIARAERDIYGEVLDPATKGHLNECPLHQSYENALRLVQARRALPEQREPRGTAWEDPPRPRLPNTARTERR